MFYVNDIPNGQTANGKGQTYVCWGWGYCLGFDSRNNYPKCIQAGGAPTYNNLIYKNCFIQP